MQTRSRYRKQNPEVRLTFPTMTGKSISPSAAITTMNVVIDAATTDAK